jgi:uncharacterized protein with HEPN domain
MSPGRSHIDYLDDIRKAAEKAIGFVGGMSQEAFTSAARPYMPSSALWSLSVKQPSESPQEVRDKHPDVPWRSMAGIRDKLIHDYVTVNLELIWKTVLEDLPDLLPKIGRIMGKSAKR